MAELVNPESLAKPIGYSNGVAANGFLYVAGQTGWNKEGVFESDDMAKQFEQALKNISEVIKAAGTSTEKIVRMTIYVTDKKEYIAKRKEIGIAYKNIIGRRYPAMALLEVKALLEDKAKVEIETTVAL